MLRRVEVASFAVDSQTNAPLIILKEAGGERTAAVPIGPHEANAIAIKSLNVVSEKPLTVDLMNSVMAALGGRLEKSVVYRAEEGGWCARIFVVSNTRAYVFECRPSDAISLALRCGTSIFVDDAVFETPERGEGPSGEAKLRENIASLDTMQFGTYYLE